MQFWINFHFINYFISSQGALPFDDDNLRNLLEKVKKGVFHIPSFVPHECQSLLRAMIEVDPDRRISVRSHELILFIYQGNVRFPTVLMRWLLLFQLEEVLNHPWVRSDNEIDLRREMPMVLAVQTAVIPSQSDIDPDIFNTMTSLQCYRDRDKLISELLSPL